MKTIDFKKLLTKLKDQGIVITKIEEEELKNDPSNIQCLLDFLRDQKEEKIDRYTDYGDDDVINIEFDGYNFVSKEMED